MPSKYNKSSSRANFKKNSDSRAFSKYSLAVDDDFHFYNYPFTMLCTAFLVVVHFLLWILAPTDVLFTIPPEFVYYFAQVNSFIIHDFLTQWYRLFTSLFIHENIFHLAGNLLFFVIFSIRLEELKGSKITALIFLISGLAGNLVTIAIFWDAGIVSLGASGAINGVFMANMVTMRKKYDKGALTMLAFVVIFASFTIAGSNSNFFAHLGGLLGGGLAIYGFEKLEKSQEKFNSI